MSTGQLDSDAIVLPDVDREVPPTSTEELDRAVEMLAARAPVWTAVGVQRRLELVREMVDDTLAAAPAWCLRAAEAKGIRRDSPLMGEDWVTGPLLVLRYLKTLERTLVDIQTTGRPQPPELTTRPDGRVAVTVTPASAMDRLLLPGVLAQTWLTPDVDVDQALARMGRIYRSGYDPEPGVALVLGAGNLSAIAPTDALHQLFAHDRVVVLKMNPVNAHLGPHLAEALQALVREGFLRIVYGGAEVGGHLAEHGDVTAIHLTGSDRTHDAVVFGTGEEGARRKAAGQPRTDKAVSAELGNITPVIVVPGPWSSSDFAHHGDGIASMMIHGAGYDCVATRLVIQHRAWAGRLSLANAVRASLRAAEPRVPYYPGAVDRWRGLTAVYPSAEWFGETGDDRLPFTFVPDLDPTADEDPLLDTEPFLPIAGEIGLDAPRSIPEYLDEAVAFCNERLWGTLAASILVHPRSLKDPAIAAAVERAVADLRYGTVAVNDSVDTGFGLMTTPWGAYPGSDATDPQSGYGVVHNTFLLEDVEKAVVRGPFRPVVRQLWFHNHRTLHDLAPLATRMTATEDFRHAPALLWHAARG